MKLKNKLYNSVMYRYGSLLKNIFVLLHNYLMFIFACAFICATIYAFNNPSVWWTIGQKPMPTFLINISSPLLLVVSGIIVIYTGIQCYRETKYFVVKAKCLFNARDYLINIGNNVSYSGLITGIGNSIIAIELDLIDVESCAEITIDVCCYERLKSQRNRKLLTISPGLLENKCEFILTAKQKWQAEIVLAFKTEEVKKMTIHVALRAMSKQQKTILPTGLRMHHA